MLEYISKKTIKESKCKQIFTDVIQKVQKDIRNEGITFSYNLVGSAKRNMIIVYPNKPFDCDYQIFLQKNKKQLSPKQIKEKLIASFNKNLPKGFNPCENSTTAITIKKVDTNSKIAFGYDIVIIAANATPQKIIRHSENVYTWNELPDMRDYTSNLSKIKGADMWKTLRERYLQKREVQSHGKYPAKKSFQIFNEALIETLSVFSSKSEARQK